LDASLTTLICEKITVVKCKELKTGCIPEESSKEGHGSKRAVLLIMMIPMKLVRLVKMFK
jgi:hypothetical protein